MGHRSKKPAKKGVMRPANSEHNNNKREYGSEVETRKVIRDYHSPNTDFVFRDEQKMVLPC
ncbi:hypothetical protein NC652_006062 [Populus alba x Populus x berolinensis]|nr:hypothetical protein NC652_006062 [Populus alba x Populus x berolinensis]